MSYVVNNHLNDLYVLSNKAVGPGKKISKIDKRRAYVYSGGQSMSKIFVFLTSKLSFLQFSCNQMRETQEIIRLKFCLRFNG